MRRLSSTESEILLDAVSRLAAADGITGMPIAAQISYLILDEEGEERAAGFYSGGVVQAMGLVRYQQLQLDHDAVCDCGDDFDDDFDDEEDG